MASWSTSNEVLPATLRPLSCQGRADGQARLFRRRPTQAAGRTLDVSASAGEWALAVAHRSFIDQYDEIPRELTWLRLSTDLHEVAEQKRRAG
jgi:hypothetical protein